MRKWKITETVDGKPVYWIIRGKKLIAIVYGEEEARQWLTSRV